MTLRGSTWLQRFLSAGLAIVALPLLADQPPPPELSALQAAAHAQVDAGFDRPDEAMDALQRLQGNAAPGQPAWLVVSTARGLVAANDGRPATALQAAAALAEQAPGTGGAATAALLRAAVADVGGRAKDSVAEAETALAGFARDCPAEGASALCDWRLVWRARQMLARQLLGQGKSHPAREQALAAAALAHAQGDSGRQALSLTVVSRAVASQGERDTADRFATQALQLARADGGPALLARMALFESQHRGARGDEAGAQKAAERGLVWARQSRSPRLEAMLLTNLSDSHLQAGRPRQALADVARALPVARRFGDRRNERILLANDGLARIALRDFAAAQRQLEELLTAFDAAGASGEQAELLREFADALAAAGELPAALKLYHRERQLKADLMAANRDAALAELRARFQTEAQHKRLAQLARDNALIGAELDNRLATQQLAIGAVSVGLLASALAALAFQRMRRVNRQLALNRDLLRQHAQRDPLTGLANRRALSDHLAELAAGASAGRVRGSWLLVDIDHFKRINDEQGHAAGDAVLVEIAQRLVAAVRPQDLVVRWGGEEFLIHAPDRDTAQARALARRLLVTIGERTVALPPAIDGTLPPALRVTASIGFASFPLAPAGLLLPLESAVNLIDMALYTAKTQGRNRAVGIVSLRAVDAQGLEGLEADLEAARSSGRLRLDVVLGPPGPPTPAARPLADAEPAQPVDA